MTDKHSPDSLKYQWRILGHVLRSGWATSLDKSIAFEIVDNYVKRHGNSRASLSYLVKATGADRKSVIASTRRLVEHGPFSVARQGVGTRPTEYVIHFDKVQDSSSSGADTTTSSERASSGVDTTTGGGVDTTTSASSSGADTTESVLHVAAYKAGVHDRMIEPAPAAPPLSGGLSATDAGSAGGGFEELWKAYGHRQKKADAKAAYVKAAPDADQHARMVAAAKAWFAAWAAQGKAEAPRFTLGKWIEREEFECDPPTAYKPKERKAKPAEAEQKVVSLPEPVNDTVADGMPYRRETLEIIRAYRDVDTEYDEGVTVEYLNLDFLRLEDGEDCCGDSFIIESSKKELQDQGQEKLRTFLDAAGLHQPDNAEELVGKTFVRIMPTKFAPAYLYEPVTKEAAKQPWLPPGYVRPWERPRAVKKVDRNAIDWSKYRSAVDDDEEEAA